MKDRPSLFAMTTPFSGGVSLKSAKMKKKVCFSLQNEPISNFKVKS